MAKNTDRWMFYLPNDNSGRAFLETLKSVMNTDRYSVRIRGRRPDRDKAIKLGYCDHYRYRMFEYSVPIEIAKLLAVYVEDKVDDKRRHELWQENYELRQQADRAEVREARITELENQNSSLMDDLQMANIEASYDDLQQEYRYNPDKDTIKVKSLEHNQVVLNATVKENEQLREQIKNQAESIQHFQRIEESNNLLQAQVTSYEQNIRLLHDQIRDLQSQNAVLQNKLGRSGITECPYVKQGTKQEKVLRDRIRELEQFIQRLEHETAGINCLLQNDMKDLDIPLDDS